jgi:hypothetical protein
MPFTATEPGAVQPTPPAQAGWPSRPQPPQPPLVHSPVSLGQPASPAPPMHSPLLLLQHPPPAHAWPGQHGWPGPPHALHMLLAQVRPEAVQKLEAPPAPWQHGWPWPPQLPQEPELQVPSPPAHIWVMSAHRPAPQHAPLESHACPAQHGSPGPPHVCSEPLRHTVPPSAEFWPEATHRLVAGSRQAPERQPVLGQGGSPAPPHCAQPGPTQVRVVLLQVSFAQQARPCPPQLLHWPFASHVSPRRHTVPVPMHMRVGAK